MFRRTSDARARVGVWVRLVLWAKDHRLEILTFLGLAGAGAWTANGTKPVADLGWGAVALPGVLVARRD